MTAGDVMNGIDNAGIGRAGECSCQGPGGKGLRGGKGAALAVAIGCAAATIATAAAGPTAKATACQPVAGVQGPRDIAADPGRRSAYIASSPGPGSPDARGAVFLVSIDDPLDDASWRDRTGGTPVSFSPEAIDLYEDRSGSRLFVVNAATDAVEIFAIDPDGGLTHIETVADPRIQHANDIAATGPRSFYLTNTPGPWRGGRFGSLVSAVAPSGFGAGAVLYFNGVSWRIAAEGLDHAAGLVLYRAPDGADALAVAETGARALRLFRRDDAYGALAPAGAVRLGGAPERLTRDETGALYIAAHPDAAAFGARQRDLKTPAPTLVLRYDPAADIPSPGRRKSAPPAVYADDGAAFAAASAAARIGDRILIGGALEQKYLLCKLKEDG